MRLLNIFALGLCLVAASCTTKNVETDKLTDYTQYVDPYIGTGGHGHVFVGASVPFGAVQLGATSIPESWDWCSGYHISDTTVIGFSHTHLSGTGIGDLFDVTVMPVVGDVTYARGTESDPTSGLWSYFSRKNEKVGAGYYATHLDRYGIDVELTATERVGFHKYTFPKHAEPAIVFDLENGGCWDATTDAFIEQIDSVTVVGYRYSKGWADNQRIYFAAELSKPIRNFELINGAAGKGSEGRAVYARVCLNSTRKGEQVFMKVGISPVSEANALANLNAELPDWDFEATKTRAKELWNNQLSKIDIKTDNEAYKRIFYTAMYHTMIAPSVFMDVNGDYRGADADVYYDPTFTNYTTLSLWDTYRAANPLMTIIHPEKVDDMINTMLHICIQQGKLPVWHLAGCETNCMVGSPGIPVVADAILKGFTGFSHEQAYQAMKHSAMRPERGVDLLMEHGYIPADKKDESVAYSLEYALADWAVGQVALKLGKTEDAEYFINRSKVYTKYFDKETQFMRGVKEDGTFTEPFNPFHSAHRTNDYCEGNAWQYTWLVPHDVEGLQQLFGSKEAMLNKLDSLFIVEGDLGDNASPDVSGLIGQYAHGNEPSHHIIYLYTMLGEAHKTADKVREVLTTLYHDAPDGLSGNEDAGQMSAWYILSSLGFYQVEPAGGNYYFGSPLFDEATIKVADGKTFTVTALNNSAENKYIQSIKLNGEPHTKPYITHEELSAGGTLEFVMGSDAKQK